MFETHQIKAQKKVDKALEVFNNAVTDLQTAQQILKDGITEDKAKAKAIKVSIKALEDDLLVVEQEEQEKVRTINNNHLLITKLEDFKTN